MKKLIAISPFLFFLYLIALQVFNPGLSTDQMADTFFWHYIACFIWPFIAVVWYRRIK